MILTDQHIEGARSDKGGWNKHQLHILGVAWPPPKGWKKKLAGSEIDPEVFEEFRRLGTITKQERAELNRQYAQRIASRQGGQTDRQEGVGRRKSGLQPRGFQKKVRGRTCV